MNEEAHKARGDHYEMEHRTALDAIDIIERRERATEVTLRCVRGLLAIREKELLDIKGPCSNHRCSLHYAHSGPCDAAPVEAPAGEDCPR